MSTGGMEQGAWSPCIFTHDVSFHRGVQEHFREGSTTRRANAPLCQRQGADDAEGCTNRVFYFSKPFYSSFHNYIILQEALPKLQTFLDTKVRLQ